MRERERVWGGGAVCGGRGGARARCSYDCIIK